MKNINKRLLPLLLTLTLALSFSITALANETSYTTNVSTESNNSNAITLASSTDIVGMHVDETSSTSEIKGSFYIGLFKSAAMSGSVTVNQPCTIFVILYDSNGKALGSSSLTMTRAGTFNLGLVPSTLSHGNYSYGFLFDKTGVNYDLYLYATM